LLILPDNLHEAEFHWRIPDGASRTLWLAQSRHAIFIPKNIPYKILWKKQAALARISLDDAFIARAIIQRRFANVQILHEWELASVDLHVHFLFNLFEEQCRHFHFPDTNPYMAAASHLFAVHALKIFATKETKIASGLAIPSLRRVQTHIEKNLGERLPVAALAGKAGLCPQHFTKLFKISTNMTPHQYVLLKRIEQAQQLLASGMRAADVAAATGFADQSHLLQTLKRYRADSKPNSNRIAVQP